MLQRESQPRFQEGRRRLPRSGQGVRGRRRLFGEKEAGSLAWFSGPDSPEGEVRGIVARSALRRAAGGALNPPQGLPRHRWRRCLGLFRASPAALPGAGWPRRGLAGALPPPPPGASFSWGSALVVSYFYTGVSSPGDGIPEFMAAGYVDDQLLAFYSSSVGHVESRARWAEEAIGGRYWDAIIMGTQQRFRADLRVLQERYDHTGGGRVRRNPRTLEEVSATAFGGVWVFTVFTISKDDLCCRSNPKPAPELSEVFAPQACSSVCQQPMISAWPSRMGYQRQLNYKHADGSYSAFGEDQLGRSEPGNSWLTAFVLKIFQGLSRYSFVSENHITEARTALASRQKENGCFQGTGTLLNNALKGGIDDKLALSAYVTIALLELNLPVSNSVVRNGLFCLETAAQAKYSRALLAYAFSLAGKEDKREELLRTLLAEAVKEEDGSIHWLRSKKQEEATHQPLYRPRAPSAEVELTAYVLLALISKQPAPSQEELNVASGIVKWLSQQQNPTGGFASTQDTVVALQALALYSSLTYRPSTAGATVSLRSGDNVLRQFQVDSTNRLLLQCQALPAVPGDYSPEVTGAGCIYLQITLIYSIQPREDDTHFALDVCTVPETCTGAKAHTTFDIAINVSYTGQHPVSNMAIVDIKMLSGFVPVKTSVRKLEGHNQVKRTEVNLSHVLLYLEQVTTLTQSFSFTVEQDVPVQGLKPAVVKVYDYYETDEGCSG
ncbi:alpha-2-macroglobulin-like [Tiliqua scincoides]|uniref:alpha-2-macroglobulin-like n=1 Tax=Tiliqua scincoides TaxID=71010 RepID=UPI003462C318